MRRFWILLVCVPLVTGLLCHGSALAGKPDKPPKPGNPGGGSEPPSGTIYYLDWGTLHTMDAEGNFKTALPPDVGGDPSIDLHGDHRWFLQLRGIAGEVYPDCTVRVELFAVWDDEDEPYAVQLTNDPYQKLLSAQWADGDALVTFEAFRWDEATPLDCEDPPAPAPAEAGIYAAEIFFDAYGNVDGPVGIPTFLAEIDYVYDPEHPEDGYRLVSCGYDLSPDAREVVYCPLGGQGLTVLDTVSGTATDITSDGVGPRWQPLDGAWILFQVAQHEIFRIRPDGADRERIIRNDCRQGICYARGAEWSPTGTHMIYQIWERSHVTGEVTADIYRANDKGKEPKNLTGDIDGLPAPLSWR